MSNMIFCPICGKPTRPDYCSDECLYTSYERDRISKLILAHVVEWIDHKGDAYFADVLTDLIDGKTEQ